MGFNVSLLIPILGIMCGLLAIGGGIWLKAQKLKLDLLREQRGSDAANGEMVAEMQRLKDRVAVLERLLTDDDRKLAGEIERLRREDARG